MKLTWNSYRPYGACALYLLVLFAATLHPSYACGSAGSGGGDLTSMTGLFEYVAGIMSGPVFKTFAIIAGGLLAAVAFFDGGQLPQLVRLGAGVLGGFSFLLFILGWIAGSSAGVPCVSG
jgi:hypothetical protein